MSYDAVYNELREYMITGRKEFLSQVEKSYHEKLCLFSDHALFHFFVLQEHMKNRELQDIYQEKNMGNVDNTTKVAIFMLLYPDLNSPFRYRNLKHVLNAEMSRRAAQQLFQ
tara:strand:- start:33 stop:368 length:336 start_codon:yes stop_codon:yes gene_type:complete